jgi:hypothetical protein
MIETFKNITGIYDNEVTEGIFDLDPNTFLKVSIILPLRRLYFKVGIFNFFSLSRYSISFKDGICLVALLCTFSMLSMSCCLYGDGKEIELQNSDGEKDIGVLVDDKLNYSQNFYKEPIFSNRNWIIACTTTSFMYKWSGFVCTNVNVCIVLLFFISISSSKTKRFI